MNSDLMEHRFKCHFAFGDHRFEFCLLIGGCISAQRQFRFVFIYHRIDTMYRFTYIFVLEFDFDDAFRFEYTTPVVIQVQKLITIHYFLSIRSLTECLMTTTTPPYFLQLSFKGNCLQYIMTHRSFFYILQPSGRT